MLKNNRPDKDWTDFTEEDYCITSSLEKENYGLMFLCPGCKKIIGIATPPWTIDFEKLTARASILHTRATEEEKQKGIQGGCGWHGYLTEGVFTGQIE